jgi:hypothetical protein
VTAEIDLETSIRTVGLSVGCLAHQLRLANTGRTADSTDAITAPDLAPPRTLTAVRSGSSERPVNALVSWPTDPKDAAEADLRCPALWVGSMAFDWTPGAGSIYRVGLDGSVTKLTERPLLLQCFAVCDGIWIDVRPLRTKPVRDEAGTGGGGSRLPTRLTRRGACQRCRVVRLSWVRRSRLVAGAAARSSSRSSRLCGTRRSHARHRGRAGGSSGQPSNAGWP